MKSSTSCRSCGFWLEGAWNREPIKNLRDLLQEQMDQGCCTRCAVKTESVDQLLARLSKLEERIAQTPEAGRPVDDHYREHFSAVQEVGLISVELARRSTTAMHKKEMS